MVPSPQISSEVTLFSSCTEPCKIIFFLKKKKHLKLEPIKCITKLSADSVSFNSATILTSKLVAF